MARKRKPRTNADAANYWAESILASEPAPELTVNSVIVRGDTIYSFGSHFPMGHIIRDSRGRAKTVLINSDRYTGASGFANTSGDQWNVKIAAEGAIGRSRREIEVREQLLSSYTLNHKIQVRPRKDDPEPEAHPYIQIPRYFCAANPGPEPVKDPEGCIAGTVEHDFRPKASWSVAPQYVLPTDELPSFRQAPSERGTPREVLTWLAKIERSYTNDLLSTVSVLRDVTVDIHYVENYSYRASPPGSETKQCPHCKEFNSRHDSWAYAMRKRDGFVKYTEMMDRFGSEEGWREARREEVRRVRRARKERAAWDERNFIPESACSRIQGRIRRLDKDGYALRKDSEAYFKAQRAEARRKREEQRTREAIARMRERREANRRKTFMGQAAQAVANLAAITNELQSSGRQVST